ncbi:MAG: response regulator [Acidimicrobiia bacterium]|nr:response regulator [Acidimicrobiia bacterium]
MTKTRGPIAGDPTARTRGYGSLTSRLEPTETVLVVEDEHDIATFLRAYFRASGTDVVHVDPTTAADVAVAVAAHQPICVLLDLNLRGFSGLEAYDEIQASGTDTPVILVTADPNPATHRRALEAGVVAVVSKPFSAKELYALVCAHSHR